MEFTDIQIVCNAYVIPIPLMCLKENFVTASSKYLQKYVCTSYSASFFYQRYLSQVHRNVHVFLLMSSTNEGTPVANVSIFFFIILPVTEAL